MEGALRAILLLIQGYPIFMVEWDFQVCQEEWIDLGIVHIETGMQIHISAKLSNHIEKK